MLTVPVLLLSHPVQRLLNLEALAFSRDQYVLFALATMIYLYGGSPFLLGLVQDMRARLPGMMTLIGFAITVAYGYSAAVVFGLEGEVLFWELATLIDIMLLGHWLEMRSVMGASRALEQLVQLLPAEAHKLEADGALRDVPLAELQPGDRVRVRPGEKVPVDGRIQEGETEMDESMLTGESKPVTKGPGETVIAGSVNGAGALQMVIERTGEETYLAQVINLVRRAQESRSRTQDLANRAALALTVIALGAGGITLAVWLILGQGFEFGIQRAVTVMVISCPHALGLAVPLVVAVSTALSANNGLLIRDRTAFERGRGLQAVVFDKTGTLTEGRFGVSDVVVLDGELGEEDVIARAASVERQSEHTIARGIVREAERRGIRYGAPRSFQALPGKGAEAVLDGENLKVVSPGYLQQTGVRSEDERVQLLAEQGKTVVYLLRDDRLAGAIALADVIREESREAIKLLREMGVECMMLTGDSQQVAAWVAGELGLDGYFAEVLPHEKSDRIEEIKQRGRVVALVAALNPKVVSYAVNSNPQFIQNLLPKLDPAAIAGAVNADPAFLSVVLKGLGTGVLAEVLNGAGDWTGQLLANLDTAALGNVINSNGSFLAGLIAGLNPGVVAGAVNANPGFVQNLVVELDTSNLAELLGSPETSAWLSELLGKLDVAALAGVVNTNPAFLSSLIRDLDPAGVARAVSSNPGFLNGLLAQLSLAGIDPGAVAGLVSSNAGVLSDLLTKLDPEVIASLLAANPCFVVDIMNEAGRDFVVALIDTLAKGVVGLPFYLKVNANLDEPLFERTWFKANMAFTGVTQGEPLVPIPPWARTTQTRRG